MFCTIGAKCISCQSVMCSGTISIFSSEEPLKEIVQVTKSGEAV